MPIQGGTDESRTQTSQQEPPLKRSKPITRSRKGCLTCRGRKVKCDETEPRCGGCFKLGLDCRWPTITTATREGRQSESSMLQTEQPDPPQVVSPVSQPPATSIMRDLDLVRSLNLPDRDTASGVSRFDGLQDGDPVGRSTPTTDLPANPKRYLDLYHSNVYSNRRTESFIQRGALLRELQEYGTASLVILAICASAYRFSDEADSQHPDGGAPPARWARHVLSGIMSRVNEASEELLAATLILVHHERASGRLVAAWNLVGLVGRMAFAMRLNLESAGDASSDFDKPPMAQETRHRLMWASYSVDSLFGAGLAELTSIPVNAITIPLPIPDHCFNLGIPTRARYVHELARPGDTFDPLLPGEDGVTARRIRLQIIRQDVLTLGKNMDRFPSRPWDANSPFNDCLLRLRHWYETLPAAFHLTPANLFTHHGNSEAGAFVNLHIWHQQLHCDLYRIAFPGFRESARNEYWDGAPEGYVDGLRKSGYEAACAVASMYKLAEDTLPGQVAFDLDAAVIAYESIRIQLQYLGIVHGMTHPPDVAHKTNDNFEALLVPLRRLTKYYCYLHRPIRDINRLLARHGYFQCLSEQQGSSTPGYLTPSSGPNLHRMHVLSRSHLRASRSVGDPKVRDSPISFHPQSASGQDGEAISADRPHAVRFDKTNVAFPPLDNAMFGLASPAEMGDRTIDTEAFDFGQVFGLEAASSDIDLSNNRSEIDPFWPMLHSWTAIGASNDGFNFGG